MTSRSGVHRFIRWGLLAVACAAGGGAARPAAAEDVDLVADESAIVSATPDAWSSFRVAGGGRSFAHLDRGMRFVRGAGDNVAFSRTLDAADAPGFIFRFNVTLAGQPVAASPAQTFRVGSGFGAGTLDDGNALTFARLGINTLANGTWQVRDLASGENSPAWRGTQAVTWAMNRSKAPLAYAAPNGMRQTVGPARMDVWVGRVLVFDEMPVTVSTAAMSELKWVWHTGTGVAEFDHFDVATLPEPETGLSQAAVVNAATPTSSVPAPPADGGKTIELYRPSPNPFAKTVTFAYAIGGGAERVDIGVYDLAGRRVRGLVTGTQTAGTYEARWDGLDDHGDRTAHGVYFLRAAVGANTRVLRVVHLSE